MEFIQLGASFMLFLAPSFCFVFLLGWNTHIHSQLHFMLSIWEFFFFSAIISFYKKEKLSASSIHLILFSIIILFTVQDGNLVPKSGISTFNLLRHVLIRRSNFGRIFMFFKEGSFVFEKFYFSFFNYSGARRCNF